MLARNGGGHSLWLALPQMIPNVITIKKIRWTLFNSSHFLHCEELTGERFAGRTLKPQGNGRKKYPEQDSNLQPAD